MKRGKLLKTTFVTLMVCATAGTLFACGGDKEYKVVYLGGEGATGDAPAEATYKEGDKFNLATNTFTKANHTFKGWSDGTSTYLEGVEYTMGTADVTFTALWEENSAPITYTVTYALGDHAASDATVPSAVGDLLANAQVTLPAAPKAAEGYEFKGWKVGSESALKNAGDKITVTANVTVTAQWKAKEPPVDDKYVTDAEVGAKILNWWTNGSLGYFVGEGEELTIQATITKDNADAWTGVMTDIALNNDFYRFRPDGYVWTNANKNSAANREELALTVDPAWNDETVATYKALFANGASVIQVIKISLKNNVVTLSNTSYAGTDTALATPVVTATYTVTSATDISEINPFFYTDGGAVISTASAKYAKASNTFVNLTFDFDTEGVENAVVPMRPGKADYVFGVDPTKAGYTFDGWKSSDESDTTLYKNTDTVPVTVAVTYTAQWTVAKYTVTYALGGNAHADATAPEAVSDKLYGDKINLPDAPAAAAGYEFDGWKVGDDTTLKAPATEIEITGDVTITAVFKGKEEYRATYKPGDHAADPDASLGGITVFYDDAEITLPNAPEAATGYEFAGWKVGDATELKQTNDKITLTANTDIVAQWKAIEYTVTFNVGEHAAEGATVAAMKADYNTEITLPAGPAAATGYSFTGWKVGTSDTVKQAGDKITVTANVTVTAQWVSTENSWTVTFFANEGDQTAHHTATVEKGGKLTLPSTDPTKTGYRFDGWYLSGDETKTKVTADTVVTANSTYLALWVETVVATFKANADDDAAYATVTVDKGATLTLPENDPEKTGYTFKGWYREDDTQKTHLDAQNLPTLNEAVTYLADWGEITYTVTFKVEGQDDVELTVGYGKKLSEVEGFSAIVTAKEYYRFDGWKNGQDTATGDTIPTADITYTAAYTQVEALPSANQNPTADTPIVIGTDGTQDGVNWTGYRSNVANTPAWVGKIARGEKLVLTGIQKSQGINIWDGLIYSIFSGVQLKGQQNVCFNHMNMNGAVGGDLFPLRSIVTDESGAEINGDSDYDNRIKALNADCNITITWDWSIAKNAIFLTIKYEKENKSAEVSYRYNVPQEKNAEKYSIGLDTDGAYAEIANITKSTVDESELDQTLLEIGQKENKTGYTGLLPLYAEKLKKGEKIAFTGEMTSPGTGNFQTLGALIYGVECKGYFRMDWCINEEAAIKAAENWNIVLSEGPNWDGGSGVAGDFSYFQNAIKDCTITLTFDWTNENEIVIFFDLTSHAETPVRQTMKYTITATDGNALLNEYTIGLGTDTSYTKITSIVRTPAAD